MRQLKLTDVYSLHRIITNCFPKPPLNLESTADTPLEPLFLFADNGLKKGLREIIILSTQRPDQPDFGQLTSKIVSETFLSFPVYRFIVTINPTKRRSSDKKIVPLTTKNEIVAWFKDKSNSWGFEIKPENLEINQTGIWRFSKKGQEVTIAYAKINGLLQVLDHQIFTDYFKKGLGRAKTFGCGLLQLSPYS
jgi:CRISPR system Cascade subunit CasE